MGLAALLLAACAVPEHMEVRAGIDPRNQDDDVRFRTTYYFRVFDACPVPEGRDPGESIIAGPFIKRNDGPYRIVLDSLYRFRMTGKANALFSKIHFESGTLHKSEIDPFGAAVVFDEKSGRFHFESREKTEAAAEREVKYDEIQRRLKVLEDLNAMLKPEDPSALSGAATASLQSIQTELGNSIKGLISGLDGAVPTPRTGDDKRTSPVRCPDETSARRGFQILGPEGWRTFDQDERLLIAMTSSAKPLISALKELSGRLLNEQPTREATLLPLVQERLRIVRAERRLDRLEAGEPKAADEALKQIIDEFDETQAN